MQIFDDVISSNDIQRLVEFFADQPISNTRYLEDGRLFRNMKHSFYDRTDLLPYQILNPILTRTIGNHYFDGGHYLDAHWPFLKHFDTKEVFDSRNIYSHQNQNRATRGVLFPFVEDPRFNTIFFDYFLDASDKEHIAKNSTQENTQEIMDLLDHHSQSDLDILRFIPVTMVAEWKIGRMITWSRNQLHCSSNFAKYGLTKQGLVLWV